MDNASDFLNVYYPNSGRQDRFIAVNVQMGRSEDNNTDNSSSPQVRIRITNSNRDNNACKGVQ